MFLSPLDSCSCKPRIWCAMLKYFFFTFAVFEDFSNTHLLFCEPRTQFWSDTKPAQSSSSLSCYRCHMNLTDNVLTQIDFLVKQLVKVLDPWKALRLPQTIATREGQRTVKYRTEDIWLLLENIVVRENTGLFHPVVTEKLNDGCACYLSKVSHIEEIEGFK